MGKETELPSSESVLREVLVSYASQYSELLDTWKLVETKAQSSTAIAGIFLAACFSWLKDIGPTLPPLGKTLLSLTMMLLLMSIWCAIQALRIRNTATAPHGIRNHDAAMDSPEMTVGQSATAFSAERLDRLRTLADWWNEANKDLISKIRDKSCMIQISHNLIILAATVSFFLSVMKIQGIDI